VQPRRARADGKTVRRVTVLLALVATLVAAAPAEAVTIRNADKLERAVRARVNAVRKNHGLKPLAARPRLAKAAGAHVVNMARNGYFAHEWSDGTSFGRWIRRYWPGPGYRGWSAGENLYWEGPSTTARRVVKGWMGSPGHRKNMLSRSWRYLGVGAVKAVNPSGAYRRVDTAFIVALELGNRTG
jgi:uncharacterized protein YkwD